MSAAIRVRDLARTYPGRPPVEAARGLDPDAAAGERFGLLGPNGAGRTTAREVVEGLLGPTSGEVEDLGRRWDRGEAGIRVRVGVSLRGTRPTSGSAARR